MADNDFDSDAMLAFFGQMGKGIDELKTKVTNLNQAGDAMKKMTHVSVKLSTAKSPALFVAWKLLLLAWLEELVASR